MNAVSQLLYHSDPSTSLIVTEVMSLMAVLTLTMIILFQYNRILLSIVKASMH